MRPLLLLVLLAFCVNLAAAAELTARLDREQIADDETVGLSLILSGGGGTPDLSPLEADFDIIDNSFVGFTFPRSTLCNLFIQMVINIGFHGFNLVGFTIQISNFSQSLKASDAFILNL